MPDTFLDPGTRVGIRFIFLTQQKSIKNPDVISAYIVTVPQYVAVNYNQFAEKNNNNKSKG